MVNFSHGRAYVMQDLLEILRTLRAPGGCPWDRAQNHASIRQNLLEEAYEVCGAIDEQSPASLCEELGDLLLQVVFHAQIASEAGSFSFADVTDGICRKLIERHPHIFGNAQTETVGQVLTQWEEIKQASHGQTTQTEAMDSVTRALPALMRAEKVQKKASRVGFDWPDISGALAKLDEECEETRQAIAEDVNIGDELGDLLFSAVNVARFVGVDPELALTRATDRFRNRFSFVEQTALSQGRILSDMTLAEMDALWEQRKRLEREKDV